MVVTLVILSVFVVLFFFAALIITAGLNARIGDLENDLQVNKTLYDSLEEQNAKHFANEGTLGNRLEAVERSIANLEAQREEETRLKNKTSSKKKK